MPRFIKKLSQKDSLILLKMHNQIFLSSHWKKNSWNFFLSPARESIFCAIKESGNYAGFVMGKPMEKNCSIVLLSTLLVLPAYQRSGYGKKLVDLFLRTAFAIPTTKKVILHFRETNRTILLPYYKKMGFGNHKVCGTYTNKEAKHYMSMTKLSYTNLLKE